MDALDERWDAGECLDGPEGCRGEVLMREALSGSGLRYPRCDHHWERHVECMQPRMDAIRARYPEYAPADFDPEYAGVSWYEEE